MIVHQLFILFHLIFFTDRAGKRNEIYFHHCDSYVGTDWNFFPSQNLQMQTVYSSDALFG